MGKLVQNYDELLKQLVDNSVVAVTDDKLYWDNLILKEMVKLNIKNPEIGMQLDIKLLEDFETKSGKPYYTKFAVTGVREDDVYNGGKYVTTLLAI